MNTNTIQVKEGKSLDSTLAIVTEAYDEFVQSLPEEATVLGFGAGLPDDNGNIEITVMWTVLSSEDMPDIPEIE